MWMKSPTNDGDKATVKMSMPGTGYIMIELLTEDVVWSSHQLRPWPKLLSYLQKLRVKSPLLKKTPVYLTEHGEAELVLPRALSTPSASVSWHWNTFCMATREKDKHQVCSKSLDLYWWVAWMKYHCTYETHVVGVTWLNWRLPPWDDTHPWR